MRIAEVAPLIESVPPKRYGGTERVVAWIVDDLVRRGHDVTLYAASDSHTAARLRDGCGPPLGLDAHAGDVCAHTLCLAERVIADQAEFDLVHFHCEVAHLPVARRLATPHLTTLHGRLDHASLRLLYDTYAEHPLVSISDAQRRPLGHPRWAGTVYHGLPRDLLTPGPGDGGYLAFLGRMSPEKGPPAAIAIARGAGLPLRMAAKIDGTERAYFEAEVEPLLGGDVTYVGQVDEPEKQAFLGGARALLFPIDWPEPFGLVMIEAMACGTPVIAFRCGSVPEVIDDGVSGIVVDDVAAAIEAVGRIDALPRSEVRAAFERRFTVERMVDDYLRVYGELIAEREAATRQTRRPPSIPV